MIRAGYIDVLDQSKINAAIERINILHEWWIPRGIYSNEFGFSYNDSNPLDFYTLGAATYIDCWNGNQMYLQMKEQINPILKDYFDWLYDHVIHYLDQEIGTCELNSNLAHPGFHIFGCKPGQKPKPASKEYMEKPIATIHFDLQQDRHLQVWEKFNKVDLENCLSFTLCLDSPKTGSALNTWNCEEVKCYEINDDYTRAIKSLKYGEYGPPNVVPYVPGKMFYFVGPLQHQIAPGYNLSSDDRRITLQGHGVLCDGVWQLYF